ncbi:MAG: DegV family protein [Desulfobacteraceae bacterium]|nr:DegV family protein [Desulfobacteraceae bacterium]
MAKNVAVVCDSTADFPPGMVEQLGLHVLPVHIFAEKKDHLHGQTITNKEVIKKLKKKKEVYTTPFYPYECTKLFDSLLQRYDEVVSLHLSREISGNYKSAWSAREFMGDQDAQRVHILDLGSVSISLSLLVKKAVELLNKGVPAGDLQRRLAPYQQNVFFAFTVENLIWLKKGGRVNAFEAFLGNMLNFKPIIQLQETRLEPVERHRGKKPALSHLVSMAEQNHQKFKNCEIWMAHADNLEEVMITREKLASAIGKPPESILLAEVGATISAHTGPGSVFISMLPQKNGNKAA